MGSIFVLASEILKADSFILTGEYESSFRGSPPRPSPLVPVSPEREGFVFSIYDLRGRSQDACAQTLKWYKGARTIHNAERTLEAVYAGHPRRCSLSSKQLNAGRWSDVEARMRRSAPVELFVKSGSNFGYDRGCSNYALCSGLTIRIS